MEINNCITTEYTKKKVFFSFTFQPPLFPTEQPPVPTAYETGCFPEPM